MTILKLIDFSNFIINIMYPHTQVSTPYNIRHSCQLFGPAILGCFSSDIIWKLSVSSLTSRIPLFFGGVYVKRQQCLLATHNCLVFWQQNITGEMATNTSLVLRQHSIIVKATGIC